MAYKIIVLKRVQKQLWEAIDFYNKRSYGLGFKFQNEFDEIIVGLEKNPDRFTPTKEKKFRRTLFKKFPYKVIFKINEPGNKVTVILLWNVKRNPKELTKLLKSKS